jgi:hypothetical protein
MFYNNDPMKKFHKTFYELLTNGYLFTLTTYPRVEHLYGAVLGKAPVLTISIRLGWNGLPGTNPLADYKHSKLKRFLHHGKNCTKIEVFQNAKKYFLFFKMH